MILINKEINLNKKILLTKKIIQIYHLINTIFLKIIQKVITFKVIIMKF